MAKFGFGLSVRTNLVAVIGVILVVGFGVSSLISSRSPRRVCVKP